MNDLLKGSSEFSRDRSNRSDIESGHGSCNSGDLGLAGFFNKVQEIEKQYEKLDKHLKKLQIAHEETKAVTKAPAMKLIKQRMERDVDEVGRISRFIRGKIEELDREVRLRVRGAFIIASLFMICSSLFFTLIGFYRILRTGVNRVVGKELVAVKKKFKDKICEFQTLRQNIHQEYREVVERRTVDRLIETGDSEQIFQKAIMEQGRGQIMDTLAEIQERHDAVRDLEKKLLDLQQVFLDMAVLVDAQGEMLDNIENMVSSAIDHVQSGNNQLTMALKKQKSSRKWMCIAILILLIIIIITVVSVVKPWTQKQKHGA
ncbi:unnamed protein product [Eruca vesicaria subsp. sativa]|uniref:t-SNARE coiled-coil homology domain-containing protein n=1 Tax=Eruca vesicaria subsp. sativa TaxID=29727 RepID=A0ABC8LQV6_ERUVS|nr:unnamed protein product [Eruca vesicaria subsp. sativa]